VGSGRRETTQTSCRISLDHHTQHYPKQIADNTMSILNKQTNILFIVIDGLRYDRLGHAGYSPPDPSPFLDQLLNGGLSAARAYSLGCPTQFVFPSLMTSTYPLDQGGYEFGLHGRSASWIECIKEAGDHQTGAFVTGSWLSRYDNYQRGFDQFYQLIDLPIFLYNVLVIRIGYFIRLLSEQEISEAFCIDRIDAYLAKFFTFLIEFCQEKMAEKQQNIPGPSILLFGRNFNWIEKMARQEQCSYQADKAGYIRNLIRNNCQNMPFYYMVLKAEAAHAKPSGAYIMTQLRNWIDRRDKSRPICGWVHLMDVHDNSFRTHDMRSPVQHERQEISSVNQTRRRIAKMACGYRGKLAYDLGIAYIDCQLGFLHEFLRVRGLLKNTLLVITSDHGLPGGWPQRKLAGLDHFFDEYVHIPLGMIHPKISATKIDVLVTQMDVGPTVLDLLGIAPPASFQGVSLFSDAIKQRDTVLLEHLGRGPCDFTTKPINVAIVGKRYKLMFNNPKGQDDGEGVVSGFYDLLNDPDEMNDLSKMANPPAEMASMRRQAANRCREICAKVRLI
jgi:arylsulfatase A-like enzyme